MARKFLKRILPQQDHLEHHKVLNLFGGALLHPAVWTLHRRSVAGGVAAGLFFGLFPAPFQMLGAAVAALFFRWNLPVAVFATLYTNPITFVPLYLVGLKIGMVLLNAAVPVMNGADNGGLPISQESQQAAFPPPPDFIWSTPIDSALALGSWILGMGWPLLIGVLTLASTLAVVGYFATRLGWNIWVRYEVIQRRKKRQQKL
jgi:uncharacterized protein (DUF2062 family)